MIQDAAFHAGFVCTTFLAEHSNVAGENLVKVFASSDLAESFAHPS